jgi:uncharacterized protein (TIGR03435 family)
MRFLTAIAALVFAGGFTYAQDAAPTPTFEVASVKPAAPPDGRGYAVRATGIPGTPYGKDPGRFTAENYSLPNLIMLAYDIPPYRLSGGDELHLVMFNIQAKMPVDATKEQFQLMLQDLLAQRFGLKVHWVSRQMNMYELVVAKSGSKLKAGAPDPPSESDPPESPRKDAGGPPKRTPDGFPIPPPGNQRWMAIMGSKGAMRGHNETAAEMASAFSIQIASPVTDATGLTGKYDYTIFWSARATRGLMTAAPAEGALPAAAEPDGPSLFVALQDQLGLKLEARKGPVQVLVVDHVDRTPTEN